jgi:hypothetical protein
MYRVQVPEARTVWHLSCLFVAFVHSLLSVTRRSLKSKRKTFFSFFFRCGHCRFRQRLLLCSLHNKLHHAVCQPPAHLGSFHSRRPRAVGTQINRHAQSRARLEVHKCRFLTHETPTLDRSVPLRIESFLAFYTLQYKAYSVAAQDLSRVGWGPYPRDVQFSPAGPLLHAKPE